MIFKPKRTTTPAPLRLTHDTRQQARKLARQNAITESSVYRQIIEDFFDNKRHLTVNEVPRHSDGKA